MNLTVEGARTNVAGKLFRLVLGAKKHPEKA
jgi:hypothetical protein